MKKSRTAFLATFGSLGLANCLSVTSLDISSAPNPFIEKAVANISSIAFEKINAGAGPFGVSLLNVLLTKAVLTEVSSIEHS